MVLVDTSVWVAHFRYGEAGLTSMLQEGRVVCHPLIIGELACGNLKNRAEILVLLQALPGAIRAKTSEVLRFIEDQTLMGKGLKYLEIHLLASALLSRACLWTLNGQLHQAARKLRLIPAGQ